MRSFNGRTLTDGVPVVSYQVTNKAARICHVQHCAVTNDNPFEYSYTGCRGQDATKCCEHSYLHGASPGTRYPNATALHIFSAYEASHDETK